MKKTHNLISATDLITDLGLEAKQAQIYLAALETGGGSITDLARVAGIERTNVYYHIGELLKLGLLKESRSGKRSRYVAGDPIAFQELLQSRKEQLDSIMPTLTQRYQQQAGKSTATYYEGKEGLMNLYETYFRILKGLPKGTEFMVISRNFVAVETLPEFLAEIVAKRMKLPVHSRGLFPTSERIKPNQKIDQKDLVAILKYNIKTTHEKKYIPDKYMPGSTVLIFGKYVVMIDWKNLFGSLTENQVLADTWSKFFDFAWDHLPSDKA